MTPSEDEIEQAYWEFDAERKRTGAERDAFKRQVGPLKAARDAAQTRADENHRETQRWHAAHARAANEADYLKGRCEELYNAAVLALAVLEGLPKGPKAAQLVKDLDARIGSVAAGDPPKCICEQGMCIDSRTGHAPRCPVGQAQITR